VTLRRRVGSLRVAAKCLCVASVTSRLSDTVARMPTRLSRCHAPFLVQPSPIYTHRRLYCRRTKSQLAAADD